MRFSRNFTTKMIDNLGMPGKAKAEAAAEVKVNACDEYIRMKLQVTGASNELKALSKQLQECSSLLATLKQDPRAECKAAYTTYHTEYQLSQNLVVDVTDQIGIAKAIAPEDVDQSKALLDQLKKERAAMYTTLQGIKDAKVAVKKLLNSKPLALTLD
jgi:hypothetical protein